MPSENNVKNNSCLTNYICKSTSMDSAYQPI